MDEAREALAGHEAEDVEVDGFDGDSPVVRWTKDGTRHEVRIPAGIQSGKQYAAYSDTQDLLLK